MSVLAIIPARGGSKGIPRKNVRPLAGRPLVAWTIEAAQAAQRVDRVVVSTDNDEIAAAARHAGAEVVIRPAALSGDRASSESALLHVLDTLREREGYEPAAIAFLQCTSPLTLPEDIDGTLRLVLDEGYDSAVTMTPFHGFLWRAAGDGKMVGVNHVATRRLMRQEREPEFLEVGAVYAMRAAGFREAGFRFFGRIGHYPLPPLRALELDSPDDWTRAAWLMQHTGRARRDDPLAERLAAVRLVVTDFDGVLTDNRVTVSQEGVESVVCNRGDGWGIGLLKRAGLLVVCLSTETNPVVQARCRKLDVPCWDAQRDKLATLRRLLAERELPPRACLYVGNDTNDAACLEYAGVAVVPRDAAPEVVPLAHWQTEAAGGEGVLREVARRLLAAQNSVREGAG